MISSTVRVLAVLISERLKAEPVCSTLLGHFPSSLTSHGGVNKPISVPDVHLPVSYTYEHLATVCVLGAINEWKKEKEELF